MKNNDAIKVVQLTSSAIESITEKLHNLVATNADIPTLAYAGDANAVRGCGCKNGCEGGCTSW